MTTLLKKKKICIYTWIHSKKYDRLGFKQKNIYLGFTTRNMTKVALNKKEIFLGSQKKKILGFTARNKTDLVKKKKIYIYLGFTSRNMTKLVETNRKRKIYTMVNSKKYVELT